jgi:hypothetical protein
MLFRDRRVKFKSPQVEALAKASAAGARGIKAMPDTSKDSWKSGEGKYERSQVKSAAREAGWANTTRYNTEDRGDRYQEGARVVEAKQQAEKKVI